MNIELLVKDEMVVTSSLNIANNYEKEHFNVLKDIRELIKTFSSLKILSLAENVDKSIFDADNYFREGTYPHPVNGKELPMYWINRRGFDMLVLGYSGTNAIFYRACYIDAFEKMKDELQRKETEEPNKLKVPSPCMAFGKLYGSAVELMDDCMSIQFHDDPFELSDLMRDRTIVMIIRLLDYFRFPKMPSMVELKKMVQFVRMYTGMDFAEKLFYCFENNKLSIPYLMVVLENHTTKEYPGIEFQRAMAQKYLM